LEEAGELGGTCLGVFLFDRDILDHLDPSDRRVAWIRESIVALDVRMRSFGSRLHVLHGRPVPDLTGLIASLPELSSVHCVHDQEPARLARDRIIDRFCQSAGMSFRSWKDVTVLERDELLNGSGQAYRVYTPYRNAWRKRVESEPSHLEHSPSLERCHGLAPAAEQPPGGDIPSLADLGFPMSCTALPSGEDGAKSQILQFQSVIPRYGELRDIPAVVGTSHLSTALRFGTISVRSLLRDAWTESVKWCDELIWREFHHTLLWHFPDSCSRAFQKRFEALEWDDPLTDPTARNRLAAWQTGMTGFPVIDAAQRELLRTGLMHNRMRMVTASFLTKDLHIHWKHGERWFARHLLDYDMAANVGNWQWAASTGADGQPWFRIFHPTTQGKRWDPDGTYIARHCPELAELAPRWIHEPSKAPPMLQPQDYPPSWTMRSSAPSPWNALRRRQGKLPSRVL